MLKLKSLLYIAVCTVTATLALAQPPERRGPGFEPRPPGPLGRIEERLGELGLSDEQKERLKKLNRDTGREIGDLMRKLREAHREFDSVLKEYNLDRRKALASIKKISGLQRDILNRMLESQLELRRILKPDQFEKFQEITRRAFEEERQRAFGRRPPPPPQ
jgi:Spy/CpxP family protein refolding chaperone